MLCIVLAAALVLLDQAVKLLVRINIEPGGSVPFLPHILELTYIKNTGAAFSMFSRHTWVLAAISAVVAAVILVLLARKTVRHPAGRAALAVVLAGAVGNLIDRVAFGYVTDMFRVLFMDFAVFNVADICIVCGGIAFCVYFAFFFDRLEGKGAAGRGGAEADR